MGAVKRCTACQQELDLEAFSLRDGKLIARCKVCVKADRRARYLANRDNLIARQSAYNDRNRAQINERQRAYQARNPEAVRQRNKDWYEKNREYAREKQRLYCEANRETESIRAKTWREHNRERHDRYHRAYYRSNQSHKIAEAKKYRVEHPEECRALGRIMSGRRRARARGLSTEHFEFQDIWDRDAVDDALVCYLCNLQVERSEATIDHLIPIAAKARDLEAAQIANPGNVLANAALVHARCNSRKCNRLVPAAVAHYRFLSSGRPSRRSPRRR